MKLRLILASIIFSVSAAVGVFLANCYWIANGTTEDYEPYLQTSVWDDVLPALTQGVSAQVLFALFALYPLLKLGRKAEIAFFIVNFIAAAFATLIFTTMANPMNYAGWGYLSLILLAAAPISLGIVFSIQAIIAHRSRPLTS